MTLTNSEYFAKNMRILVLGLKFYCVEVSYTLCVLSSVQCPPLQNPQTNQRTNNPSQKAIQPTNQVSKQEIPNQTITKPFFSLLFTWKILKPLLNFNKSMYGQNWHQEDCWWEHHSDGKKKKCLFNASPSVNRDTFYIEIKCYSVYDSMWDKNMLWSKNEMAYCSSI